MVYIVRNFYTNRIHEVFGSRTAAETYIRDNDTEFGELDILEKEVK